ncbi:MAG: hypothetical protein R3Y63_13545 [Eubacteriales bacterium]
MTMFQKVIFLVFNFLFPFISYLITEDRERKLSSSGIPKLTEFRAEIFAFRQPYIAQTENLIYIYLLIVCCIVVYMILKKNDDFDFCLPVFSLTICSLWFEFIVASNSQNESFRMYVILPSIIVAWFFWDIGKLIDTLLSSNHTVRANGFSSVKDIIFSQKLYFFTFLIHRLYFVWLENSQTTSQREYLWKVPPLLFVLLTILYFAVFISQSVKVIKNCRTQRIPSCKYCCSFTFDIMYLAVGTQLFIVDPAGFASGIFFVFSIIPALAIHSFLYGLGSVMDKEMKMPVQ